jgi:hypothetical protein
VGVINIFSEFFLGGDMKKKIASLLAGALAVLCVAVTANATAQFYNFESSTSGWAGGSGVALSNASFTHGASSLVVRVDNVVSNDVNGDLGNTVWTDFYTIPVRYSSAVNPNPVVDPAATGQFYVNSNGFWVTMSGSGGSVINVCTQSLVTGMTYPTVTQYTAFYHVSVFQDYAAKKWSLFVNNVPLAENLSFIDQDAVAHDWFQVQNFGGHSTNVCWLDDFLLTNAMVTTGGAGTNTLTAVVPGTTLPIADALVNFGSTADPRPTNETVGVAGAGSIALGFGRVVDDGRKYVVYGTTDHLLGGLTSNGIASIISGSAYFTNSPLVGTTNRYYYKLVTISSNGAAATTNTEAYAGFKQYRYANQYSIAGHPVQTTDRTMGGEMGAQLAIGLPNGSTVKMIAPGGTTYTYTLSNMTWSDPANDLDGTNSWPEGVGLLVEPFGSPTPSYFAGIKTTNAVSVIVSNAWTYLSWVHDDEVFSGNGSAVLGFSPTVNDYIIIQTNGSSSFYSAKFNGTTWNGLVRPWNPLNLTIKAGDGMIYYNANPSDRTFNSSGP